MGCLALFMFLPTYRGIDYALTLSRKAPSRSLIIVSGAASVAART